MAVKFELFRCPCDDVIAVEVLRSELSRRSLAAEPDKEFNRNVNIEIFKKLRFSRKRRFAVKTEWISE